MINAKTIMTENVITINENATIAEGAKFMVNKHVTSLLVIKNDKPIAIVTQSHLIKGTLNKSPSNNKIKNIMSKEFLIVNSNANYSYLIKKLREDKIKIFPVVEQNKLIGIITETDIVDATRDFTKFHRIMQEIILAVFGLVTAFFLFFFSPLGQAIFRG